MMKKIMMLVLVSFSCFAIEVSDNLLNAMCKVESNCKANAVGDNGKASGILQIHKCYVSEVNRICSLKKNGKKFTFEDRYDINKSKEMVKIYLQFWGGIYEKQTGKKANDEVLAKIHNGHTFWKKSDKVKENVQNYWKKVEKKLVKK